MPTFPPTVSQPGAPDGAGPASPSGGQPAPAGAGGGSAPGGAGGGGFGATAKLAMLSQVISQLAKDFPQGQSAIQMMMQGLRQLQGVAAAQSAPAQPAAPPM